MFAGFVQVVWLAFVLVWISSLNIICVGYARLNNFVMEQGRALVT